jgi:hypothetical protein
MKTFVLALLLSSGLAALSPAAMAQTVCRHVAQTFSAFAHTPGVVILGSA